LPKFTQRRIKIAFYSAHLYIPPTSHRGDFSGAAVFEDFISTCALVIIQMDENAHDQPALTSATAKAAARHNTN
jgi:hypothetical protein